MAGSIEGGVRHAPHSEPRGVEDAGSGFDSRKPTRPVFLVSKAYPGVCSVADHGLSLGLWDKAFVEDHTPGGLASYDRVILGAWHPSYEPFLRLRARKALLWTSSPGQSAFREKDVLRLVNHLAIQGIFRLWFGSAELAEVWRPEEFAAHFPYPVSVDLLSRGVPEVPVPDERRRMGVSLFSPDDPRKNLMAQYQGFVLAKREENGLSLFSNCCRDQPGSMVNNYGWLPRAQLEHVLAACRTNLSVFPYESFSYATVEAIMAGAIPIVSPAVAANLRLHESSAVVANVDSPREIARAILAVCRLGADVAAEKNGLDVECVRLLASENNAALKALIDGWQ